MSKLSYEEKLALMKTVQEEKKIKNKSSKSKSERNKLVKNGSYSVIITAVIIVILVVVNLIVNKLPATYTELDISSNGFFTLSDRSKEILESIDEDVTIYYLVEDGMENVYIQGIISQYEGASERITVEKIDPVAYPTFASQYSDASLSQNSVIVVSGDKSRAINYSEMYEVSYSTSQSTGETTTSIDAFDGEGQITSAIAYVTSDSIPVIYELTGHGECSLSELGISDMVAKENMELVSLSLLQNDNIPQDCAALIINAPTADLSADEAKLILNYTAKGGRIIVLSLYNGESSPDIKTSMPNLTSVLNAFGVEPVSGLIIENSNTRYYSNQMFLLPDVKSTDIAGDVYDDNRYILMPYASGIAILEDASSDLNILSLLTTSDSAFSKLDVSSGSYTQNDEDIAGPFDVAVAVTNSADSSKLVYFSSAYMLEPGIDAYVSGANTQMFMNALTLSVGNETSVSIEAKSLEADPLIVNSFNANLIKIVTQYLIPIVLLAAGGAIWYVRRKK